MKKTLTILALSMTIIGTLPISYALTTGQIDNQKDINHETVTQILNKKANKDAIWDAKANDLTNRYYNNIKTCEPAHFDQYIDFFGLKISIKADINGWIDNKCNYTFSGKIGGLGKDIKEVFEVNIADQTINKFEPKFECNFTKSDLENIVTVIKEASASDNEIISQTLQSPEKKYSKNNTHELTKNEEKLLSTLTNGKTCKLLNKDELMNNFTEIMESGDL